jgi:hypothetical protein
LIPLIDRRRGLNIPLLVKLKRSREDRLTDYRREHEGNER